MSGLLGKYLSVGGSVNKIYVSPATNLFVKASLRIVNTTSTDTTVNVAVSSSINPANSDYIFFNTPLKGNCGSIDKTDLYISPGESVYVSSVTDGIAFRLMGVEFFKDPSYGLVPPSPFGNGELLTIVAPTITFPPANSTLINNSVTFSSTPFQLASGYDTFVGAEWQISLYSDFSVLNWNSGISSKYLTSYPVSGLTNAGYYVRVRYYSSSGVVSNWSSVLAIGNPANNPPGLNDSVKP